MTSARGVLGMWASMVACVLLCPALAAQSTFQATLSADTVDVGEVFEFLVRVPVPAGSLVHFPDTVATTEVLESVGPVRWSAEPEPAGGATLSLAYPVMAYGAGMVAVPGFDVFVSPSASGGEGARLPGGSVVGAWDAAPARGAAYVRPLRVPRRGVWVTPVFTPEQVEAGIEPMPSADVLGSSWHWPSVAVGLLFAGLLAVVVVRTARGWMEPRARSVRDGTPWTPQASRQHALAELDRLLAEGLHANGRTHELYSRSSSIVRHFVERLNPEYSAAFTSSELMGRLGARRTNGHETAALFEQMGTAMGTAEVVKFGRLRPGSSEAEAHVRSLRAWVEGSGGTPW